MRANSVSIGSSACAADDGAGGIEIGLCVDQSRPCSGVGMGDECRGSCRPITMRRRHCSNACAARGLFPDRHATPRPGGSAGFPVPAESSRSVAYMLTQVPVAASSMGGPGTRAAGHPADTALLAGCASGCPAEVHQAHGPLPAHADRAARAPARCWHCRRRRWSTSPGSRRPAAQPPVGRDARPPGAAVLVDCGTGAHHLAGPVE